MKITVPFSCLFIVVEFCLFLFGNAPAWAFGLILAITIGGLIVLPTVWTRKDKKAYNKGICPKCGRRLVKRFGWYDGERWVCENYTCDYKATLSWWRPNRG